MQDEAELRKALVELAHIPEEPADEERIRKMFRRHRRRAWVHWISVAVAASLAMAVSWSVSQHQKADATPAAQTNPFLLLPYGQSDVPLESGVVVRVRLQSDAGPVDAEVLVGQDGIARAVRIAD